MTPQQRYQQAHEAMFKIKYAAAYNGGFYCKPKMPKLATANGLTNFIVNFIDWTGGHANRISSAGRYIPGTNKFDGGMFIPSTTKKGTADVSAIINGKAVMLEVKVGKDKPSEAQLNVQNQVRAAGGVYEFVSTPEEFFAFYDKLLQL
jgi:hypothetical protein